MNYIFLDLDGVILKECGVVEIGYAFILYILDNENIDKHNFDNLILPEKYINLAS